ncbi:ATP-binding protein [Streptomyces jumonjinensis]|uniref:ATP-binding protein n=1 Tax=Streptomyces jumonjinensis TaxID=1945 RepID=UPI0037B717B9
MKSSPSACSSPSTGSSPASPATAPGHGLGLAIVRSIVHAHHGTVTAHANPDGGLTVRAKLPPDPR